MALTLTCTPLPRIRAEPTDAAGVLQHEALGAHLKSHLSQLLGGTSCACAQNGFGNSGEHAFLEFTGQRSHQQRVRKSG